MSTESNEAQTMIDEVSKISLIYCNIKLYLMNHYFVK